MTEYTSADVVKSMKLFFIDNQGAWPAHKDGTCRAKLVGDLVVWPDDGRYPTYVPVAVATHPNYDGCIVVQAGNRGILITFVPGATTEEDVRAAFNKKSDVPLESYRLSIDAIVHRMVLHFVEQAGGKTTSEVDPLSLMSWMAASDNGRNSARVIAAAAQALMARPETLQETTRVIREDDPKVDAFAICDGLVTTIQQSIAARTAQTKAAPVVRRK